MIRVVIYLILFTPLALVAYSAVSGGLHFLFSGDQEMIVMAAYYLAAPPSLVTGLVDWYLARRQVRWRLLWCVLVGAVSMMTGLVWIIDLGITRLAIAGAVATVFCWAAAEAVDHYRRRRLSA